MEPQKIVAGANEDEIWQQLAPDFAESNAVLEYQALIDQAGRKIILDIDIDPGGGFESGYATTSFSSPINNNKSFDLQIYKQNLLAEAGKLFGMQDVETGYEEIDKRFVIKTNDEAIVKQVFSDYSIRKFFEEEDFELNTTTEKSGDEEQKFLELTIEDGITNAENLQKIYSVFFNIVNVIDAMS